jgi:hypothetical protein
MSRRLNATVTVHDDKGNPHAFGPADTVPAWARKLITNPDVWVDSDSDDAADPDTGSDSGGSGGDKTGGDTGRSDGPPPKSGAGSGAKAWRGYAEAEGVTVDEKASRDDVIAALEAAGVPTEAPAD